MNFAGVLTSVQVVLADGGNSPADVDPTTGHGPEWGKAGPIGLLTVVLLCVAVYFLVKSLNRQIKKVPESFEPAAVAVTAGSADSATDAGTAAAGSAITGDVGVAPAAPTGSDAATGVARAVE